MIAGRDFGDFIVWRRDDVPAYQLAVVVDDAAMRITEVVRGADLLKSTARQLLVFRALGLRAPDRPRRVGEQQLFQRRAGGSLQAAPIVHGHQNGGLGAALGDDLRTLAQARLQELAEARLGVLDRPDFHFQGASRDVD